MLQQCEPARGRWYVVDGSTDVARRRFCESVPREVPSGDLLFAGAHVATGSRTPRRIFVLGDILQTRALAALAGHGPRRDIVMELDLRIAR